MAFVLEGIHSLSDTEAVWLAANVVKVDRDTALLNIVDALGKAHSAKETDDVEPALRKYTFRALLHMIRDSTIEGFKFTLKETDVQGEPKV
jgi:flagellar biosynthesis regulator FlbT